MGKNNYNFEDSLDDMDAFYEEMQKAGFAENLDVSSIVFEKKKKNKNKENAGRAFFDKVNDKKSKHYEKNEWKKTFSDAGEKVNNNKPVVKNERSNAYISRFKVFNPYKRYVFDDGVAPVAGTSILRNPIIAESLRVKISRKEWNDNVRDTLVQYLLSTRYPAAIYEVEEFSEIFGDFKGFSTSNNYKLFFIPLILTEEYLGLYIINVDSLNLFENSILDWCNDKEFDAGILLTDWIQLIETSAYSENKFVCDDDVISDIYKATSKNREDVKTFVYQNFTNEVGVDYEALVNGIIPVEKAKANFIDLISKITDLNVSSFDDDEDSYDDDEINNETFDVSDFATNSDESEEEVEEPSDEIVEKIPYEKPEIIEEIPVEKILEDVDNESEEESESTEVKEMSDDEIDNLIESKMKEIIAREESNDESEEEPKEKEVKTFRPALEESKVVSNKNSAIVMEQKGDDPDAIVIKPFKKG